MCVYILYSVCAIYSLTSVLQNINGSFAGLQQTIKRCARGKPVGQAASAVHLASGSGYVTISGFPLVATRHNYIESHIKHRMMDRSLETASRNICSEDK